LGLILSMIGGLLIAIGLEDGGMQINKKSYWLVIAGILVYGIAQHV